MTSELMEFSAKDFLPGARAAFEASCGFQVGNEKHKRMFELADNVLDGCIDNLHPRAIISAIDGSALNDDTVSFGGFKFRCPAFSQLDPRLVRRIHLFVLTVGEFTTSLSGITATVFADMWGTVFCDESVEAVSNRVNGSVVIYPGLYGLPLSSVQDICSLLDGKRIGVSVREPSYVMTPIKSCCGIIFEASGELEQPESKCEDCIGNKHWCIVCKKKDAILGLRKQS